MVYCFNCGKEIDTEANFCSKCGVRTDKGVKEGISIPWTSDPHWRKELETSLQKASKAIDEGVRVAQSTIKEVVQEVDKGVREARITVSEKTGPIYCRNCGQENTRYSKYCTKCGKEL